VILAAGGERSGVPGWVATGIKSGQRVQSSPMEIGLDSALLRAY
jgi:hypothetical protein